MSAFNHKPTYVAGSQGDSVSAPAILADSLPSAVVLPSSSPSACFMGGVSELLASSRAAVVCLCPTSPEKNY